MSLFNLAIKRRAVKQKFHFFDTAGLEELLKSSGFHVLRAEHAYGDTDVFTVATKALIVNEGVERPISLEIARVREDFDALYHLRYLAYCKEIPYLDPKAYADGKEMDKYDPYSIHIIARDGHGVIGTLRMIKDNPAGFLMEEGFELPEGIDRTKALEHSRAAVNRDYRNVGLHKMMIEAAYVWHRENGYNVCIGAGIDQVTSMLLKRGWKQIGESKLYHGTRATPILFHLDKA